MDSELDRTLTDNEETLVSREWEAFLDARPAEEKEAEDLYWSQRAEIWEAPHDLGSFD